MSNYRFDDMRLRPDTRNYSHGFGQSMTDVLSGHRASFRGGDWSRGGERGHGNGWGNGWGSGNGWARGWETRTAAHSNFQTQASPHGVRAQADWSSAILSNLFASLAQGGFSSQAGANPGFDFSSSFTLDPDGAGPQRARTVSVNISSRADDACGCQPDAMETAASELATEEAATDEDVTTTAAATDDEADVATTTTVADDGAEPACDLAADETTDAGAVAEDETAEDGVIEEPPVEAPVVEEAAAEETATEETATEEAADCAIEETPVDDHPVEETPEDDVPEHDVSGDGQGWGDPHFVGADGEKYDVQGEAGKFYNLLSDKGMQVNAQFSTYAGNMTVMSELGVTAGSDQIKIGKNAALSINGETIDKDGVYLDGRVERSSGKVTVKTEEYTVAASGSAYLDVTFSGKNVQRDGVMPAGIWGVTLDGDGKPRLSGGMFGTEGGSMQGGGVLEKADGSITDKDDVSTYKEYEVASLMDLLFPSHNRYAA